MAVSRACGDVAGLQNVQEKPQINEVEMHADARSVAQPLFFPEAGSVDD